MKKLLISIIFITILLGIFASSYNYVHANTNLITDVVIEYTHKVGNSGNSRVIANIHLSEAVDLSKEKTNIIIDYYTKNSDGSIVPIKSSTSGMSYSKDKSWAGYLNTYTNYPEGEQKYSKRR